jgi:WD40 repeat protein
VGCDRADGINPSVIILDAQTGEQLEPAAFDRFVTELAFSPDGRLLASIEANGKVQVFDRHLRRTVLSELAHGRSGFSIDFSPDGRTLATASTDGQIKFWHLPTMMHITTLKAHGSVAGLAFFPNGKTLAVGYSDRTIELWHVDRERELLAIDSAKDQR